MRHPLDFIEELQNKPEHVRKIIAVAATAVIMGLIILMWLGTLYIPANDSAAVSSGQPSPLAVLWNFMKDSLGQIHK